MVHKKKILEKYANAKLTGKKPWEIRKNDCNYQVDDWIKFTVIDNETKEPTGRTYSSKIKYIFEGGEYGLEKGFCIMTLD
jgi:hypothetical protein